MRKPPARQTVNPPIRVIAVGANLHSDLGEPTDAVVAALGAVASLPGVRLLAVSRFFLTEAHPPGSGPQYVNAAARLEGTGGPESLLDALHRIEAGLGRVREGARRWDSRIIDLDLIVWDDEVRPDAAFHDRWRILPKADQQRSAPDRLILPHPRMQDRRFVLEPMAEVTPPGWRHPRTGLSVQQMLAALPPDTPPAGT